MIKSDANCPGQQIYRVLTVPVCKKTQVTNCLGAVCPDTLRNTTPYFFQNVGFVNIMIEKKKLAEW